MQQPLSSMASTLPGLARWIVRHATWASIAIVFALCALVFSFVKARAESVKRYSGGPLLDARVKGFSSNQAYEYFSTLGKCRRCCSLVYCVGRLTWLAGEPGRSAHLEFYKLDAVVFPGKRPLSCLSTLSTVHG